MNTVESLTLRNAEFAEQRFAAGLKMMPSLKAIIIGCVDPRVDPAQILGIELGEVAVIRNIGGRYPPGTLQTMATLRMIAQAEGAAPGPGWNLIVLQHTDCGITRLADNADILIATVHFFSHRRAIVNAGARELVQARNFELAIRDAGGDQQSLAVNFAVIGQGDYAILTVESDFSPMLRRKNFRAEPTCLRYRAPCKITSAQARRETEIVLDARATARLTPRRHALNHNRLKTF